MEKNLIIKASILLKEVEYLKNYKKLLGNKKHGKNVNFVIKQHYGNTYPQDYERIQIEQRHTPRFLNIVNDIISELEKELEEL